MDILFLFGFIVFAYLLGAVPFGLVLTRVAGYGDIRQIGSGNIGATNVLRTGNKFLALMTVLLDSGKVAIVIGIYWFFFAASAAQGHQDIAAFYALLFGLFGIVGHCYPVWLGFKGGKGFATTLGALVAAVPFAGLCAIVAWVVTAFTSRISSLAALVAITVAPVVTFFIYGAMPFVVSCAISALVFWRHRENIDRLRKGTESKIGDKKKEAALRDEQPISKEQE